MTTEIKDIQAEIQKSFAELKSDAQTFQKRYDADDVVQKEKIDKLAKEITELTQKAQDIELKNLALQQAMQMFGGNTNEKKDGLTDIEHKYQELINDYVRKGSTNTLEGFIADNAMETKTMSVGSGENGGYTVPKLLSQRIIERNFETSPMRLLATVETISTNQVEFLVDGDEVGTGWVSELADRPETDSASIAKRSIAVHEMYAMPRATQKLISDSIWNIEAWLIRKVSDKFSRTENSAFVSGDGVGKPRGFLSYTAATDNEWYLDKIQQVPLLAATALTGKGLIGLQGALKVKYRRNAKWTFNRDTHTKLLQQMYDDNKFDALTPNSINGNRDELLGHGIVLMDDMQDIAASGLAVAFGDFAEAYTIVDQQGIFFLRDNVTTKGSVKFYMTKSVGGDVLNTEAVKIGKISES